MKDEALQNLIIYMAGAIAGVSPEVARNWRREFKKHFPNSLDPLRRPFPEYGTDADAEAIVAGDKQDIRHSQAIVVNYIQPSNGTPMEIMYAYELLKPIVLINSSGSADLSPWLRVHATKIVHDIPGAVEAFREIFS